MSTNKKVHGQRVNVELPIISLGTKLQGAKNDKIVMTVNSSNTEYEHNVIMLTTAEIENLVDATFTTTAGIINANSFDPSKFTCTLEWCVKGKAIGKDKNGKTLLSRTGTPNYEKSFWKMDDKSIHLSQSAEEQLNDLNAKIMLQTEINYTQQKISDADTVKARRNKERMSKLAAAMGNVLETAEATDGDDFL
tara:strand:+ start:118 stop:696 length:579 start_codon:yes stop_codon:yes gene_type:complete